MATKPLTALHDEESASTPRHRLTKSKFCTGVQCLKALYLQTHRRELAGPVDAAKQRILDQGTRVGEFARRDYPNGVLIDEGRDQIELALEKTAEALRANAPAIFEAALLYDEVLVRIDVLRNNLDGTWDIVEVKSSTQVKEEHLPDLAIQKYVATGSGLRIARSILKFIDTACVHPYLENLFNEQDCSEKVEMLYADVSSHVRKMKLTLDLTTPPEIEIGPQCRMPYECAFKDHCWQDLPEHSVFELVSVNDKTKFELYRQGILKIADVPDLRPIPRLRPSQVQAVKSGAPVLDQSGMREFVDSIQYPIYFLDFETINAAIPMFEGTRPYEQIPFQFSCHVIEQPGATPRWEEFLIDGNQDPRAALTEKLVNVLGHAGTILSYYAVFEKTVIKQLADHFPSYADLLNATLPRFVDLRDAFTKHYYHPDFHGSTSIKVVLPVMVPSLSYRDLEVRDGAMAQVAYVTMIDDNEPAEVRNRTRQALIDYCRQDTWAMVQILENLRKLV